MNVFENERFERLKARGFALEKINQAGETRLALRDLIDTGLSPLVIDFTSGALTHRLNTGLSKRQPIAKALGLKSQGPPVSVFDATAGLGTDALVMAALGCRVRSIERNDVIFALLQDAKTRLDVKSKDDAAVASIARRLSFEHADAKRVLAHMCDTGIERPDVVYLDPLYPQEGRSKSALPKKTMQMFRRLLDGDEDAIELWELAMKVSRNRVVVKRPLRAPSLGSQKPAHAFIGKTARLDCYMIST